MAHAPSTRLGPYEIQAALGAGGMGDRLQGAGHSPQALGDIKLLPPELTRDATAKHPFLQEAQAASALDHPNICTIYEIDETPEGQKLIAMGYGVSGIG